MTINEGLQSLYRSCLWGLALAPFFCVSVSGATENADAADFIDKNQLQQGSLVLQSPAWQGEQLSPLVHTDVDIEVTGLLSRTRVTQAFYNPSQDWVNGVYVFPLPENAAVDTLKLIIGERVIEGQIQPKKKAKAIYEQAKREGKKASLLSQNRPNMFTTAVANIGPGESVVVSMEYQHLLDYKQGRFALRFPMTILPRYLPGVPLDLRFSPTGWGLNTDQVPDASEITPLIKHPADPSNKVSIKVQLNTGLPLDKIESEFHSVTSTQLDEGRYQVELNHDVVANQDFVLQWYPQSSALPQAAVFSEQHSHANYGLLMVLPPTAQSQATTIGREVIFVLDTSGSMAGESIVQAKSALLMALDDLGAQDSFNVIEFNSYARALWRQPRLASANALRDAVDFVQGLRADGGTEMARALDLALGHTMASLRQVVFITDGSVGNEEELMSLIRAKRGPSRLFTVGIGSAPNSYFMTEAAQEGRGTFTYIGDVSQVQTKMSRLFQVLRHPALTDVFIDFSEETAFYPSTPPDLYYAEPLMLSYRSETASAGSVNLSGRIGPNDWSVSLPLRQAAPQSGLDKVWAREKITQLTRDRRKSSQPESINKEIEALAQSHHLVSEFTSLVAVDVTPSRPAHASSADKGVPVEMAKGTQTQAIFGSLPQGATPLKLHLWLALCCLLALAVYYRWPQRLLLSCPGARSWT